MQRAINRLIKLIPGRRAVLAVLIAPLAMLAACDMDSFLDPSITTRMEQTPILLPIIERLDVIEEPEDTLPGLSQATSEDLIPVISEYVFGAGDAVTVQVYELLTPGAEAVLSRRIDELGFIRLPVVGEIKVSGLTSKQLEQRIIDILHPDILRNPSVTVIVTEGRQRVFTVIGPGQGTYTIIKNNFRLLDAVALARVPEVDKLYVVRQIPLNDLVEYGAEVESEEPGAHRDPLQPTGRKPDKPADVEDLDIDKIIEDVTGDKPPAEEKGEGEGEGEAPGDEPAPPAEEPAPPRGAAQPASPALTEALDAGTGAGEGRYVNIDGKWVLVHSKAAPGAEPAPADQRDIARGELPDPAELFTQRIIEIDAKKLFSGVASVNIVIRPDDIIRVPDLGGGNIYVAGPGIARGGTYTLPERNSLTLKRLIASAGGLSGIAIPERVDLTRRIGTNQEAIMRFNYRAVAEGVQPDIFLKPDDHIDFQTNIVAGFAAVIRNSFRFSYGFGFLLDRNFGTEVFGAEPRAGSNN